MSNVFNEPPENVTTWKKLSKIKYEYTIVFCGISDMYHGYILFNCFQKHAREYKEETKVVYVKIENGGK